MKESSALEPDRIAKAVAIMDAIFISGGAAAPIFTRPSDSWQGLGM